MSALKLLMDSRYGGFYVVLCLYSPPSLYINIRSPQIYVKEHTSTIIEMNSNYTVKYKTVVTNKD